MSNHTQNVDIVVVGAGLVGALASLGFVQKGYRVMLVEGRKDWRQEKNKEEYMKRSINLALSRRGIDGLKRVNVDVSHLVIPMRGRAIHSSTNSILLQKYDEVDDRNYINSVGRETLNSLLLNELQRTDMGYKHTPIVLFDHKVLRIHNDGKTVEIQNLGMVNVKHLILGCDGAYSIVREQMSRLQSTNFHREYISHGYKELCIPPTKEGKYKLNPVEALHIWPRDEFMLIALPNPDKSFTCTLFSPFHSKGKGVPGLLDMTSNDEIMDYFKTYFPEIPELIPDYLEQFNQNPASRLVQIRTDPWNYKSSILIIGDAAHAIVPFYGQGMNAGFEDVCELLDCLDECQEDFTLAIPKFAQQRRIRADAIGELSMQNYIEMRHHTNSRLFLAQKHVEGWLNYIFPEAWIPLYKMVAFTRIPYDVALARAKKQDQILGILAVTTCVLFLVTGTIATIGKKIPYKFS